MDRILPSEGSDVSPILTRDTNETDNKNKSNRKIS